MSAVYGVANAARTLLANDITSDDVKNTAKVIKSVFPYQEYGLGVRALLKEVSAWKAKQQNRQHHTRV